MINDITFGILDKQLPEAKAGMVMWSTANNSKQIETSFFLLISPFLPLSILPLSYCRTLVCKTLKENVLYDTFAAIINVQFPLCAT